MWTHFSVSLMATAFSTADAAIIEHQVELDRDAVEATATASGRDLAELYDIDATARYLVFKDAAHGVKIHPPLERVALQFPDEALIDSVPVYHALSKALAALTDTPPTLYILADTSYGSCCVDEVAASHVKAEAVVHYGHTCLSQTANMPALYVFPKMPADVDEIAHGLLRAAEQLPVSERRAIVLTYDIAYTHLMEYTYTKMLSLWRYETPLILSRVTVNDRFHTMLTEQSRSRAVQESFESNRKSCGNCTNCTSKDKEPSASSPPSSSTVAEPASSLLSMRNIHLPSDISMQDTAALYLGSESRALTHLLLTLGPQYDIASYDPKTQAVRLETGKTNRLLMRRYATIQKARDASVVGLVIGTLGIQSYLPLLKELRRILTSRASRRKVYTISVGKLNPAKLANFLEIDTFVLVACPENSLLDTREFMRPVVTPWEMMLAVQARGGREVAWTGAYVLDFARVMRDASQLDVDAKEDSDGEDEDNERPHYSFATGTYVTRTKYGTDDAPSGDVDASSRALERLSVQPHELAVRDPQSGQMLKVLDSASLAHRTQRTWHGLDLKEGAPHAAVLEQGMAGFAQRYESASGQREGHRA